MAEYQKVYNIWQDLKFIMHQTVYNKILKINAFCDYTQRHTTTSLSSDSPVVIHKNVCFFKLVFWAKVERSRIENNFRSWMFMLASLNRKHKNISRFQFTFIDKLVWGSAGCPRASCVKTRSLSTVDLVCAISP